jgi:hypothetical protein
VATTLRTSLTLRDNGLNGGWIRQTDYRGSRSQPLFEERQMGALATRGLVMRAERQQLGLNRGREGGDAFRKFDGSKGRSTRATEADPSGVVLGLMRGDD